MGSMAASIPKKVRSKQIGGGNPKPNMKGLTQFKPGQGGRKVGSKNKFGLKLKEAIFEAAHRSGSNGKGAGGAVGYLVWLSRAEPAVFGRMMEKLLPYQLSGAGGAPMKFSIDVTKVPDDELAVLERIMAKAAVGLVEHLDDREYEEGQFTEVNGESDNGADD